MAALPLSTFSEDADDVHHRKETASLNAELHAWEASDQPSESLNRTGKESLEAKNLGLEDTDCFIIYLRQVIKDNE